MAGTYDKHEKPPEQIYTIHEAKIHLCGLAVRWGRYRPEECQKCEVGCGYGLRALELLGLPAGKPERDDTIKRLAVSGKALPTIHQRLKKRRK